MTEDEMKTKWCPFSRYVIDAQLFASGNRFDGAGGRSIGSLAQMSCLCLGSRCSAWQWTGTATESTSTRGPDIAHVPYPDGVWPDGAGWMRVNSSEDGKLITGSNGEGDPYHQVWTRPRPDGTRTGICGLVNPERKS